MSDVSVPTDELPPVAEKQGRLGRRTILGIVLLSVAFLYLTWSAWTVRQTAALVQQIGNLHGTARTTSRQSLLWHGMRWARSSPAVGPYLQSFDQYGEVPTSVSLANVSIGDDLAGRIAATDSINAIELNNCQIAASGLRQITTLAHLLSLVIGNCQVEGQDAKTIGDLESLCELRIRGTKVSGVELASLAARQPQLAVWTVEGTGLTDDDLKNWHGSPELTRLSLHESGIHGGGLRGLRGCPNLEVLSLAHSGLNDAGMGPIGGATGLTSLDLSGCARITGSGLRYLRGLDALSRIDLSDSGVTDAGLKSLVDTTTSITTLNLRGCKKLTDASLEWIARLPRLAMLDLSRTSITGTGLRFLDSHSSLGSLILADTELTDVGVSCLRRLPALEVADLARTHITGSGLASLVACSRLHSLSIAGCAIRDADIEHVAEIVALDTLDCSDCAGFSDRAIRYFAGAKRLGKLDLCGTRVTEEGDLWLRMQERQQTLSLASNPRRYQAPEPDVLRGLLATRRLPSHKEPPYAVPLRPPWFDRWQVAYRIPRGRICAVAWSPDGKQIAYAEATYVRICDAKTFETQQILVGHRGRVTSIDWNHTNKRIASASLDGTVWIWSVDRALQLRAEQWSNNFSQVLVGHESAVNAVAWRPDGKELATAGADGTIRLWSHGALKKVINVGVPVNCVAWSPDGSKIVSGDDGQQVKVWNVDTTRLLFSGARLGRVTGVAYSGDGQRFAASTWGNRPEDDKPQFVDVRLWKSDGSPVASVAGRSPNFGLQWSPSPQSPILAVPDESGVLALLGPNGEIRSRGPLPPPRDPMDEPSLAWSPDGKEIAIGGTGILTVVDAADFSKSRSSKSSAVQRTVGTATLISVGPQADRILTAFKATNWTYCDLKAGRYFPFPQGARAPAGSESNSQPFSPTGDRLLYVKNEKELGIWEPVKNSTKSIAHAAHPIRCLAWGPSDERIAYFDSERTIRVLKADGTNVMEWRPADHADIPLAKNPRWNRFAWIAGTDLLLVGSPASVHILKLDGTLAASFDLQGTEETIWVRPDLQRVAAPLENGKLVLWQRAKTGYAKSSIDLPADASSYSASHDLAFLAVGRATGDWELQRLDAPQVPPKPRLPETALAHANGAVTEIQFSPDGQRFATGGWDGLIKIWKRSGELEQTLDDNTHPIERLKWSPDGKHLLSLSRNRTVCRWSVADGTRELMILNTETGLPLVLFADGRIVSSDPKLPGQELIFLIGPQNGPMDIVGYDEIRKRIEPSAK